MKASELHPLADPSAPFGKVTFIHSDNTTRSFSYCTNEMSGSALSWFDKDAPTIGADVNKILRNIRTRSKRVVKEHHKSSRQAI